MEITTIRADQIHIKCQKSEYVQTMQPQLSLTEFGLNAQAHYTSLGLPSHNANYVMYTYFYVWPDGKFTTFSSDDTLKLRQQMEKAGIAFV
jgi:hypothetical protein